MKPTARRTGKPADVAWGFFFTSNIGNGRMIWTEKTRRAALVHRKGFKVQHDVGPIFRITPPAQIRKPRKKVNRGR